MQILSGYDLYKGKKLSNARFSSAGFYQPLNFIPTKDKDDIWVSEYINYLDWQAVKQLKVSANWMMKGYKLAVGEIEKSDYLRQDNEYADMVDAMEQQAGKVLESMEIKNYPFASTVVNILTDEFAKRVSHMSFQDKSPAAVNEMLDAKKEEINQVLLAQAAIKQQAKMLQMGLSPDSKEGQQMLSPDTLKSLPEIQEFYNKSYRNIYEEWAEKQMVVDNERFSMPELEKIQFRNMLITDREFWHFNMRDNDYDVEAWNPPQVAYRKSPDTRYISDAAWVCHITYRTVPDCVDMHGYKMSEEQLLTLNTIHGARAAQYALDGKEADQFWDGSKGYEWNRTGPGIGMRQALSVLDNASGYGYDIAKQILNEGEDIVNINGEFMVRESTMYWKTERKFYHLTKIDDQGNPTQAIVGEDYKVTIKPMYNTVLFKEKTKSNLIYGEHLDPLWANEVWGGVRLGTNAPSVGWQGSSTSFAPIYLGIGDMKTPGRLPFQFKGDKNIYGCKLPVEGRVFNDHNTKSRSMLDNLKNWQMLVNITGNLIQDTMVNDYGVILQVDPNALPKHSLNEDWGPDNIASSLTVMKTGGFLPVLSMRGSDGQAVGHEPLRRLDLSQTERLLGLMKIYDWAKMSGLDSVGMNPRRTGTPIGQESTATEVKQDMQSSYSHTEYLFSQHSDDLMPRVHQMRTDLAQYYNSTNPSLRLQYITDADEKAFFEIDGTELMGRDINCKSKTSVNARAIMAKIEQMLIQDSSGIDVFDKIKAVQVPVLSQLNNVITQLQNKVQQQEEAKQQAEQQQAQADQEHEMQLLQEKQQWQSQENDKDREEKRYVAELNAAAKATNGTADAASAEGAYQDATKQLQQTQMHNDKIDLERQKEQNKTGIEKEKIDLGKSKLQEESKRTASDVQVARINHKTKEKNKK